MSEGLSSTEYDSSSDSCAASARIATPPPRSHADLWGDKQKAEQRRIVRKEAAMLYAAQVEGQVKESSAVRRKGSREKLKWSAVKVVPGSVSVRSEKREDDEKSVRPRVDLPLHVREKIGDMSRPKPNFVPGTQGESTAAPVKGHERSVGNAMNPEWSRRFQQLLAGSSGASQKGKDSADRPSKYPSSANSFVTPDITPLHHTEQPGSTKASSSKRKSTKNVSKPLAQEPEAYTKEHDTQQKSDKHEVCRGNCWGPCLDCDVQPEPQQKADSCTCGIWTGVCTCQQDSQPSTRKAVWNPALEDMVIFDGTGRRVRFSADSIDTCDGQDDSGSAFSPGGLVTPPTTIEDPPLWSSDGNSDTSTRANDFDNVTSAHTPPHLDNEKGLREDDTSLHNALRDLGLHDFASVDLDTLQKHLGYGLNGWFGTLVGAVDAFATIAKHQEQTGCWDLRLDWTPSLDAELRSYKGHHLNEAAVSLRTCEADCQQRWEQIKPKSSEESVMLEEEQHSIPIDKYEPHHGSNDTTGGWISDNVSPPDNTHEPTEPVFDDQRDHASVPNALLKKHNDWSEEQDKLLVKLMDEGCSWAEITQTMNKSLPSCLKRFHRIKSKYQEPPAEKFEISAREAVSKVESASAPDCWGAAGLSDVHDGETNEECWGVDDFIVGEDNGSVVHPDIKDDAASANDWGDQGGFLCQICNSMNGCFCSVQPPPALSFMPPASAWDVQPLTPYTVTYSAVIEHDGHKLHIPINSMHISGPEKSIIDGGMQKVWKWVQEKGLSDKVGLQDAFDLAKSVHEVEYGGEDAAQAEFGGKAMFEKSQRAVEVDSDDEFWPF